MTTTDVAIALTIAGSDSSGGAGLQADLKTFTALSVYGTSVVTSITAQNTTGVRSIVDLEPDMIGDQLDAVCEDFPVGAAKSGMLSTETTVRAVAQGIVRHGLNKYVVDPVMVAETGAVLLRDSAIDVIRNELLPLALLVTPNTHEAEAISEMPVETDAQLRDAARMIHGLGPDYVLIKGGHRDGPQATDLLFDGTDWTEFGADRVDTENTHGTGCTLAAAITAHLASGLPIEDAISEAKDYVTGALRASLDIGQGPGPLNHFWQQGA